MLYLENAKQNFKAASSNINGTNPEVEFYHYLANFLPDKVDVDTLVLTTMIGLRDYYALHKDILSFISLVPHYVRQFSPPEFASEFRRKYNKKVLGLTPYDLPSDNYGYNEIKPDFIDISNKDLYEVFAGLYNASIPVGMGFAQYNPNPWSKEIAEFYFGKFGKQNDDGSIHFKWVVGRLLNITFYINNNGTFVYVADYNKDNEANLAQRVIATCPNREKRI